MDKLRALLGISQPSSSTSTEQRDAANAAASNLDISISRSDDSGRSNTPMPNPGPKCFRIANVPLTWSKDDLLNSLIKIDPSLENHEYKLSLYPACYGSTQTALLNMRGCTEYFQRLKQNDFNYVPIPDATDRAYLVIDSHFYDLTPLNSPAEGIVAEFVSPFPALPRSC